MMMSKNVHVNATNTKIQSTTGLATKIQYDLDKKRYWIKDWKNLQIDT